MTTRDGYTHVFHTRDHNDIKMIVDPAPSAEVRADLVHLATMNTQELLGEITATGKAHGYAASQDAPEALRDGGGFRITIRLIGSRP